MGGGGWREGCGNVLVALPLADVAELVDALDLGSSGAICESSSLSVRIVLDIT